jgi:hypothetical protein
MGRASNAALDKPLIDVAELRRRGPDSQGQAMGIKFRRVGVAPGDVEWAEQAVRFYEAYYSLREVAQKLSHLRRMEISARQVRDVLVDRGVVIRRADTYFRHDDLRSIDDGQLDGVITTIETARAAAHKAGKSTVELDTILKQTLAQRAEVDHACYSHDPLFNGRSEVAKYITGIKEYHATNQEAIAGFGFESFLANAWEEMGIKVVMGPSNFEGADHFIERDQQNDWVAISPTAISAKSESRANATLRTVNIDSLARHDISIKTSGDCVRAVAHAVDHLRKYQRMIYLKSLATTFPDDPSKPAHRYLFLEVRKEDMQSRLREITARDFRKHLRSGQSFEKSNSFNVPVYDDSGRKLFSVTVTTRPPHVRIYSIDVNYCKLISSYWTDPLPDRRVDDATARAVR